MSTINRAWFRRAFLLSIVAMLISVPAFAQVDLSGEWAVRTHEDPGQPPLGDYLGIPFNEAGRLRAETTAESIWGTPEYECRPHSAPHGWHGLCHRHVRLAYDNDDLRQERSNQDDHGSGAACGRSGAAGGTGKAPADADDRRGQVRIRSSPRAHAQADHQSPRVCG